MDDFDIDNVAFDMIEELGSDLSLDEEYGFVDVEEFKDSLEDY